MINKLHRQKGFTLLEVLIALGVLALALGAITQSVSSTTNNIAYLRDKTFAHWVAMNHVAELQTSQKYPDIGTRDGSEEMGGNEWFWHETVVDAPLAAEGISIQNVRRVDVEVRRSRDSKQSLVNVMTFIGKPIQ